MSHPIQMTDLPADRALFGGLIEGLAVAFYQNERPTRGLLGLLDWHFMGAISEFVRQGTITGAVGECVYLPLRKGNRTYSILLVGAGRSEKSGTRTALPAESLKHLKKNLITLNLTRFGVSRSDFGLVDFSELTQGALWLSP